MVFIAEAVKFITTDPEPEVAIDHGDSLKEIAKAIDRLDQLGIRMEVCSAATRAYGVDPAAAGLSGLAIVGRLRPGETALDFQVQGKH